MRDTKHRHIRLEKKPATVFFCTVSYDRSENQTEKVNSTVTSEISNEAIRLCTNGPRSSFGWPCQSNRVFHILPCNVYKNEKPSNSQEEQVNHSKSSTFFELKRKEERNKKSMKKSKKTTINTKKHAPKRNIMYDWKKTKKTVTVQINTIMRHSLPWLNRNNNKNLKKTISFESHPNLKSMSSFASKLVRKNRPELKSDLIIATGPIESLSFDKKPKPILKMKSKYDSDRVDGGEYSGKSKGSEDDEANNSNVKALISEIFDTRQEFEPQIKYEEDLKEPIISQSAKSEDIIIDIVNSNLLYEDCNGGSVISVFEAENMSNLGKNKPKQEENLPDQIENIKYHEKIVPYQAENITKQVKKQPTNQDDNQILNGEKLSDNSEISRLESQLTNDQIAITISKIKKSKTSDGKKSLRSLNSMPQFQNSKYTTKSYKMSIEKQDSPKINSLDDYQTGLCKTEVRIHNYPDRSKHNLKVNNAIQLNSEAECLNIKPIQNNVLIASTKSPLKVKFKDEFEDQKSEESEDYLSPNLSPKNNSQLNLHKDEIILNETEPPAEPKPKVEDKGKVNKKPPKKGPDKNKKKPDKDKKDDEDDVEIIEEILEPIDLHPKPLLKNDIHLRYIYENNYYNEMFERLIQGHPPKDPEIEYKKMIEAEKKLEKAARKYGKNAKDYFPMKVNATPTVEVSWDQPLKPNVCNCPFSICICANKDAPPRKSVPRGYRSSRSWLVMLYGFIGLSRAPKPGGTLMPKMNKLAVTEAHNTRARHLKGEDDGPEFCMQRCAAYQKEKPLISWHKVIGLIKKKDKEGKRSKEEEKLMAKMKRDEMARLQHEAKMALKMNEENEGLKTFRSDESIGIANQLEGIERKNDARTTRYTQTEDNGPEDYSHIMFGKLPIQFWSDIDGTKLEIIQVPRRKRYNVPCEPSVTDKILAHPTMKKLKSIYSAVFGVDPRTITAVKPIKVESLNKICYPQRKAEIERALWKKYEEKEAAKMKAIEEAKKLAAELEEPEIPPNDELFKSFELKFKPKQRLAEQRFPAYKLKPQSIIPELKKQKLEESLKEGTPEFKTNIILSTTETVTDRDTINTSDTTGTSKMNVKQFWIQRDKAALKTANMNNQNKISKNKVTNKREKNTDKSRLSPDHYTTSSAGLADISTPSGQTEASEERITDKKQIPFNIQNKLQQDNKKGMNRLNYVKKPADLNSLFICGTKITSGSSVDEIVTSEISNTESSQLSNISRSDTNSLRDAIIDKNNKIHTDNSNTFDTLKDLNDDSLDGKLIDSIEGKDSKKH